MKIVSSILILGLAIGAFAQKTYQPKEHQKPPEKSYKGSDRVTDAKLKQLINEYKVAKAAHVKKPKDAKLTQNYIDATFFAGMGTMYAENLPPRQKYSGALDYFREVKKISPKHKGANQNYDMIVKIYRDMGRPVPGEKPAGKG